MLVMGSEWRVCLKTWDNGPQFSISHPPALHLSDHITVLHKSPHHSLPPLTAPQSSTTHHTTVFYHTTVFHRSLPPHQSSVPLCHPQFCGSPPPVHVCGRDEAAYTAAFIFNKATFSMAGEVHRILCYCPPPLAHLRSDMVEDVVDGELVMATVHSCSRVSLLASHSQKMGYISLLTNYSSSLSYLVSYDVNF